ncbi:probable carboxylesterase 17 [Vicia villosa]|uniref:probable carboxylesterase 17 n=1 Tax=Vicia villosa TaxID=3911 RepID=UPI00273C7464|nr:probable carboxylesterase 17 [Vicia villosa]
MTSTTISFNHNNQKSNNIHHQKGLIIEEIEGLIKVHKDGHVERPQIIPNVSCNFPSQNGVISRDITINKETNLWARVYLPTSTSHNNNNKLPLLVYFHGGGFCVGSTSWICYHEFLNNLASKANCVVVSVNYRLAPENRLPSAYDDAFNALMWIKHEAVYNKNQSWWLKHCNISSLFLCGDSAGANIAYNVVATRLASNSNSNASHLNLNPLFLKGIILIQPFFGGEERTNSEKNLRQLQNSALSLSVSDTYWRLSLPNGVSVSRDHPYCNPLAPSGISKMRDLRVPSIMICVSELDILRDRNLEFSNCLVKAGKRVETYVYKDVGHAFQVLHNYQLSHVRTQEMVSHIKNFMNQ